MDIYVCFNFFSRTHTKICSKGELDLTMLRQICRRGRMNRVLQGTLLSSPSLTSEVSLCDIPHDKSQSHTSPLAEAQHNLKGSRVPNALYDLILSHINGLREGTSQPPLRHYTKVPHPPNTHVLPSVAISIHHFTLKSRTFSTIEMHEGNSSIGYRGSDGYLALGFIQLAWSFSVTGLVKNVLVVSPHKHLTLMDQPRNPYLLLPGFQCTVVYSEPPAQSEWVIIQPEQIIGHVAFYKRPAGTYGIRAPTTVLIESLYRNRE